MKINYLLLVFAISLAFPPSYVFAQDINDIIPDFTEEERKDLSRSFGVYTSASTVFTGLNSVSGGSFTFEGAEGEKDSELVVYRLPVSYTFGNEGDLARVMLRGVVGHFEGTSSLYDFSNTLTELAPQLPDEINAIPNNPDFIREEATSVSGGLGVQLEPLEGLTITPAFDLIWTHIRREFDYNNLLSAIYGAKFDREVFNTSLEAISYVPSLRVGYKAACGDSFTVIPSVEYAHLWTYDLWGKTSLADFSTNSGVLRTTLEAQVATPWELGGLALGLHPYIVRTDVSQAAHEGLGFSYFHDLGLDFTFDTGSAGWPVAQLRFGGAYIFAEDFHGYRIGVTADI